MPKKQTKPQASTEPLLDTLRPKRLSDFTGQNQIKKNLEVLIAASQKRGEPIDHTLFYGPPGLGKTTLANVIASEMGVSIRITSGPAIEKSGDLAAILTNLQEGDILFIDEIHRLNKTVEETLYPAMEDFCLDIVVGKGPAARTLRLDLPHFTIIGATTRIGAIASPLRDRFGAVYKLQFYDETDLRKIISRSASILKLAIDEAAARELAKRARQTPRIANRLLKRVRDFAQVDGLKTIDLAILDKALQVLEIDDLGLDHSDRIYLQTLCQKYSGGPVGLETLATTMADDAASIEEVAEPYLMQLGMVKRTRQGRVATKKAFEYLGIKQNS
ncbi:Holliday junction branch migration DNA helicase RuvB [Candidatus Beckwithbacteria bacterium]|nr:Holliday junction branch migration DNA helicase RuvB [Candidatus Beckwithbacteria bacterium]